MSCKMQCEDLNVIMWQICCCIYVTKKLTLLHDVDLMTSPICYPRQHKLKKDVFRKMSSERLFSEKCLLKNIFRTSKRIARLWVPLRHFLIDCLR